MEVVRLTVDKTENVDLGEYCIFGQQTSNRSIDCIKFDLLKLTQSG